MGISDDIKPKRYRKIVEIKKQQEAANNYALHDIEEESFFGNNLRNEDFFDGTPIKNGNDDKLNKTAVNNKSKKKHKHQAIYTTTTIVAIIFLITLIVWQNISFITKFFDGTFKKENDKTLSEILELTSDISNNTELAPVDDNLKNLSENSPVSTIEKDKISISVLNGSGINMSAKKLSEELTANGFNVKYIGNAKSFTYQQTMIYYKSDKVNEAKMIEEILSLKYNLITQENNSVVGNLYDIVIVAGKK